ncbi:uncharacterized protein J5F26_004644 [Ciconia maguari]
MAANGETGAETPRRSAALLTTGSHQHRLQARDAPNMKWWESPAPEGIHQAEAFVERVLIEQGRGGEREAARSQPLPGGSRGGKEGPARRPPLSPSPPPARAGRGGAALAAAVAVQHRGGGQRRAGGAGGRWRRRGDIFRLAASLVAPPPAPPLPSAARGHTLRRSPPTPWRRGEPRCGRRCRARRRAAVRGGLSSLGPPGGRIARSSAKDSTSLPFLRGACAAGAAGGRAVAVASVSVPALRELRRVAPRPDSGCDGAVGPCPAGGRGGWQARSGRPTDIAEDRDAQSAREAEMFSHSSLYSFCPLDLRTGQLNLITWQLNWIQQSSSPVLSPESLLLGSGFSSPEGDGSFATDCGDSRRGADRDYARCWRIFCMPCKYLGNRVICDPKYKVRQFELSS